MLDTVSTGRALAPDGGARPRSVAVVGSGVAGLTAAYELSRAGVETELFEADGRLGGHAHTQDATDPDGRVLGLDTGFLVHNERTYPHLVRLFTELGVRTRDSEMSMSVRCDGCGLEYAGARGPAGLFARPGALVRGRYLRMLAEVPRFHRLARRLLADPGAGDPSLRDFLTAEGFTPYFVSHFMTPVVSAVWSCAPDLVSADGRHTEADAVVIATQADQALKLLADPTDAEREVLGSFRYSRNPTVLHRDPSPLPAARRARSSWNYRMPHCAAPADRVRVSYHLNRLLRLDSAEDYLVTLNEDRQQPIPDDLVVSRTVYEHPVYTARTVAAQARLPELITGRTAFAGAYHGWGFHEDGCRSGVEAAKSLLGVSLP
jgi:predicted NAD/FAD-binding protein